MEKHSQVREELLKELDVDAASGLSGSEAEKRLAEHGENKLAEKKESGSRWLNSNHSGTD